MIFDKYIFDFDDTLWARSNDKKSLEVSKNNLSELNNKLGEKAIIISGNSYDSIRKKLLLVFNDLSDIKFDIWADANTTNYRKDTKVDFIKSLSIDKVANDLSKLLLTRYELNSIKYGYPECVNIKIKPLSELERNLLVDVINNDICKKGSLNICNAKKTGKTTVDILHKNNDKKIIFDYLNLQQYNTLYVGDEIDFGNDSEIAKKCTDCIRVQNVFDTKGVLKLL